MVDFNAAVAAAAPTVGTGGIQSLKDLADYSKTGNPVDTAGLTGDLSTIGKKFSDMGANKIVDATAAKTMLGSIQSVPSILNNAVAPTLKSLADEITPAIKSMIGSGTGKDGIPTIKDFLGPVVGGTVFEKIITDGGPTAENTAALRAQIDSAKSLFATAGIQKAADPATQTLGDAMTFAGSLHKWGKDQSEGGLGQCMKDMAVTATRYGEALKVSLAEGNNNNILTANGIKPLVTSPPEPTLKDPPAVEFPVSVSRDFPRDWADSVTKGYITIRATANSATDISWTMVNGDTTTQSGVPPFGILSTGNYATLYAAAYANRDNTRTIGPVALETLPGMKIELEAKIKGGSPVALG